MPDFSLEEEFPGIVVGIDEAGRGPWAGPVVAGAVILDRDKLPDSLRRGLNDSKKLSPAARERLFAELTPDIAKIGVGEASVAEIDQLNILKATFLAMKRAVEALEIVPGLALVDGNRPPPLSCPVRCIIKGDGKSLSIAAASIIAKVTRDRIMGDLAIRYPEFGWERNAGYGTAEHQAALANFGTTPEHRTSYAPIKRLLIKFEA
jgi:ribonuclease HII